MFPSTPDLRLSSREFRLPRRGHRVEECQDACRADLEHGRFAIADGATESGQAGAWARLLVEDFVGRQGAVNWIDWLPPLQSRWLNEAVHHLGPEPRLWYVDAQLEQGAFSTFLGLVIEPSGWYAQAVGDSCLFQVRGDELIERYPLRRSADFGSTPWLIGSRTSPAGIAQREGRPHRGNWEAGDQFWLMTDALAEWFLRAWEDPRSTGVSPVSATGGTPVLRNGGEGSKTPPWQILEEVIERGEAAFGDWVEQQRGNGNLRNDDVTMVRVAL
jgi:hypothetical protein